MEADGTVLEQPTSTVVNRVITAIVINNFFFIAINITTNEVLVSYQKGLIL